MAESIALKRAVQFALRIIRLYKYLTEQKREFVLSKQILLSGTHIAKQVKAALYARARQGFSNEMYVALKKGWTQNSGSCCLAKANSLVESRVNRSTRIAVS